MTTTNLDHLVLGAPDLDAAVAEMERRVGVRAAAGGRHPGFGTHNALLSLGERQYLEIIAPDPAVPAPAERPFGLDALDRMQLAGWAVACAGIEATVARAREQGYDPFDPVPLERTTPDGSVVRWRVAPREFNGGPIPFLIDWGDTPHPATSAAPGLRLLDLHIEHPDPLSITTRLAALSVDVPVIEASSFALVARIAGPKGTVELR